MVKSNKYDSRDLLKNLLGLLNKKESRKIQKYILENPDDPWIRKELKKAREMKEHIDQTPLPVFKDKVDIIWEKALQRKEEPRAGLLLSGKSFDAREWLRKILNLKIGFVVSILVLVIGLIGFFALYPVRQELCVTMAYGKLTINHNDFFSCRKYGYNLKQKLQIRNGNGISVLQINDDKLCVIQPDSDIELTRKQDTIHLDLIRGEILCSVKQKTRSKKLAIKAGSLLFTITGTKFMVSMKDQGVRLSVQEGCVRAQWNGQVYYITNHVLFTVKGGNSSQRQLYKRELDVFRAFKRINFIAAPERKKSIFISASPFRSRIYNGNILLGETPYFNMLHPGKEYHFFVSAEDHVLKEIKQEELNQKSLYIALHRNSESSFTWKYCLPARPVFEPEKIGWFLIIPGDDGFLYKYNFLDKSVAWKFATAGKFRSRPVFHEGKIFISDSSGILLCLDYSSGRLLWKTDVGPLVYSEVVVDKDKLYAGNSKGILFCLSSDTGEIIWMKKFRKAFYSPLIMKGELLFIGNLDGYFYAINTRNQSVVWHFKTRAEIVGSRPVIKGHSIFIGSTDHYLYALDCTSGVLKWKYKIDSSIFTSPVLLRDLIVITSGNGLVYAFHYSTGGLIWTYDTANGILSDPILLQKNYICVSSRKSNDIFIFNLYGLLVAKVRQKFILCSNFNEDLLVYREDKLVYRLSLEKL